MNIPSIDDLKSLLADKLYENFYDSFSVYTNHTHYSKLSPDIYNLYNAWTFHHPASNDDLKPFNVLLLGNYTLNYLAKYIQMWCSGFGINCSITLGGYNQYQQELRDRTSIAYQKQWDAVILLLDYHSFSYPNPGMDKEQVSNHVKQTLVSLRDNWTLLENIPATYKWINTVAASPENGIGIFESRWHSGIDRFYQEINLQIMEQCPNRIRLLSEHRLASQIGLDNWFDHRQWYIAKQPLSVRANLTFSHLISKQISLVVGGGKKVLVLDLDNTLWGDVIGDDGIGGIELGNNTPIGEAYLNFQKCILRLKQVGVLLTIASKNTYSVVKDAFAKHPDMLLRFNDFAAVRINWENKADNIRELAEELNLSLDSFVFFDDNPFEQGLIMSELPEVEVIAVPPDPTEYVEALEQGTWFDRQYISAEDTSKTTQYQQESRRQAGFTPSTNLNQWLESLEMVAGFQKSSNHDLGRVEQLFAKTNQFNLSQQRYSMDDLANFITRTTHTVYHCSLADRYGSSGVISALVAIINFDSETKIINIMNWVISCRVLGRGLEAYILTQLINNIPQPLSEITIEIEYQESDKNIPAKLSLTKLGFKMNKGNDRLTITYNDDTKKQWVYFIHS